MAVGSALVGAAAGTLLTWLLSDVWDVFGVSLTWVVRIADAVAFAGFAIVLANLISTRLWRAITALVAAALTAWCLFLTINVDFGQYPTVGDALGTTYQDPITPPGVSEGLTALDEWTPPADLPAQGIAGLVEIPAVAAQFEPREAAIYLPPAALTDDPPALPVVIALSGQPGTPTDVFSAGGVAEMMDGIAARNDGLAPIVVVPDQLGDPSNNPMCVDGPFGDSATYLTVDVVDWIRDNLPASADRDAWTIAGFSQGGTCAIQLGAGHPDLFGSIVDVSGEIAPSLGSMQTTIERGFGGDIDAYEAATPIELLRAGAPFTDTVAYFFAGEHDAKYSAFMRAVSAQADDAGMTVTAETSPGTAHDWNTARYGFRTAFDALCERWGITR
ncbi:alpha/beta hydrolase [Amnibacterium flavum]|uniref:alpha/beta hydrolase n=1 Tax=Amnibacterium flavum TaxID=2173173 RepID=UPI001404127A|nr:alpha/beta hydrolase-fold protein [Amnibacterium flavum]